MFSQYRQYIFKCDQCGTIIHLDFEDPKDIEDVDEDKVLLDCPCGGYYFVLRN